MRPDGFVGRAFTQRQAAELGLPVKLNDWTDDDVLPALSRRGEDHADNLSFNRVRSRFYTLAPVYDMLPMLYRPLSGETPPREFGPHTMTMDTADVWPSALRSALRFWDRAAVETGLSDEFGLICRDNLAALKSLEAGPRIISRNTDGCF